MAITDFLNIPPTNKASELVLSKLNEILANHVKPLKIALEAGDFLIFKSQETMHKRNLFNPNYNGNER